MSNSPHIETYNAPAATNYADEIGRIVYESGLGEVTLTPDASFRPVGVITDAENRDAGKVSVCVAGRCKVRCGGVITPGTDLWLVSDASANAIAAGPGPGQHVVGIHLAKAATVADEWIDVLVNLQVNITT